MVDVNAMSELQACGGLPAIVQCAPARNSLAARFSRVALTCHVAETRV